MKERAQNLSDDYAEDLMLLQGEIHLLQKQGMTLEAVSKQREAKLVTAFLQKLDDLMETPRRQWIEE